MFISIISTAISNLFFFALHVDNFNVFPKPLTKKEEEEYFKRMALGDKDAKTKLIEHNLRLVAHIIKKYYSNFKDQDELISVGTVGLIKAVVTFDSTKGNRFAAYGSRCIENEILMNFRSQKKTSKDLYMDEPLDVDKDGNAITFMDIIADENDIIEQVDLNIGSQQLYGSIDKVLDERELSVVVNRYGLMGHTALTQKEVAKKLNISRSYVSRIEKKALEKLRRIYDANSL